jgi:hypothetical protein
MLVRTAHPVQASVPPTITLTRWFAPCGGYPIGQPGQDLFASEWPVPSQRLLMAIVPDAAD